MSTPTDASTRLTSIPPISAPDVIAVPAAIALPDLTAPPEDGWDSLDGDQLGGHAKEHGGELSLAGVPKGQIYTAGYVAVTPARGKSDDEESGTILLEPVDLPDIDHAAATAPDALVPRMAPIPQPLPPRPTAVSSARLPVATVQPPTTAISRVLSEIGNAMRASVEAERARARGRDPQQEELRRCGELLAKQRFFERHVSYLPMLNQYYTADGTLYHLAELESRGYVLGGKGIDEDLELLYSPEEAAAGINRPLDDRIEHVAISMPCPLPVVDLNEVRYSALRPGALRMREGVVELYRVGARANAVIYTRAQYVAALAAWRGSRLHRVAEPVRKVTASIVKSTTRFFRRG